MRIKKAAKMCVCVCDKQLRVMQLWETGKISKGKTNAQIFYRNSHLKQFNSYRNLEKFQRFIRGRTFLEESRVLF